MRKNSYVQRYIEETEYFSSGAYLNSETPPDRLGVIGTLVGTTKRVSHFICGKIRNFIRLSTGCR